MQPPAYAGLGSVFPNADGRLRGGCPGLCPAEAGFDLAVQRVLNGTQRCASGHSLGGSTFVLARIAKCAFCADGSKASQGRSRLFTTAPLSRFPPPGRHKSSSPAPSMERGVAVTVALGDRGPTACREKAMRNYCARSSRSDLGDAVPSKLIPPPASVFITSSFNSLPIPLPLFLAFKMPRCICCFETLRGALPCSLALL